MADALLATGVTATPGQGTPPAEGQAPPPSDPPANQPPPVEGADTEVSMIIDLLGQAFSHILHPVHL